MRALLSVTWREIRERQFVLLAAVVTALVPFVVTIGWGLDGDELLGAWKWTSLAACGALALVIGAATGAGLFGSSPMNPHLAFFLARPVPALGIWAGKTAGASLLLVACILVVLAPTWAAVGREEGAWIFAVDVEFWRGSSELKQFLWPHLTRSTHAVDAVALLALVGAIPAAHVASLMVRSRDLWIGLDIAVFVAMGAGYQEIETSLFGIHAALVPVWPWFAGTSIVVSAYAGSAAAVAVGRVSLVRARRVASMAVWATWTLGLLCTVGWMEWVRHPSLEDLEGPFGVDAAQDGSWIAVYGHARGAGASFLFDPVTGRSLLVGHVDASTPVLSRDGLGAAWTVREGGQHRLMLVDLADPAPRPIRTDALLDRYLGHAVFSPSDRFLATVQDGVLVLIDLEAGAVEHETRVSGRRGFPRYGFLDDERIRIYVRHWATDRGFRATAWDLAVHSGELRRVADLGPIPGGPRMRIRHCPDGEHVMVSGAWPGGAVRLFAVDDGELVATLLEGPLERSLRATPLWDGRIVAVSKGAERASLHVFSPLGEPLRTMELPGNGVYVGCEVEPGRLALGVSPTVRRRWDDATLLIADVGQGTLEEVSPGLTPACFQAGNLSANWQTTQRPGSPATTLFYELRGRALVQLDPVTGQRKMLLGGD